MRKVPTTSDVYTLAKERMRTCFDLFDMVSVMFSGGKDSTVALHVALEVAHERKRLPLDVIFYDEECVAPETEAYVRRVAQRDDVQLRWYCLPVQHRNGCSRHDPFWFPWALEEQEKWVRPLPPEAIADLRGFDRQPIPRLDGLIYPDKRKSVGMVLGLRADESLMRLRAVWKNEQENFLNHSTNVNYVTRCLPIYDWKTADVWAAPDRFGWDYNEAYDRMARAGISPHLQRVAPPYGEEPMQLLWMWAVCWPELWDKMSHRVAGARTAARYSKTALYGFGSIEPPAGMTWQEAIAHYLDRQPPKVRAYMARRFKGDIRQHFELTTRPIPDRAYDPASGISWSLLLTRAMRGDVKGRRAKVKKGWKLDESKPETNEDATRF